jgi:AcrR family transcriptional regulator
MDPSTSKSAANRLTGKHQISVRRASILDAAEQLFLQNGLENTSMVEIASEAGINKVTLYRYFPDRDPIAFEIAARMLRKITSVTEVDGPDLTLEKVKQHALAMIQNFYMLRDAYRYIGMFDHLYGDQYPSENLARWYKQEIFALEMSGSRFQDIVRELPQAKQVVMILNTIMSFLEKMAARGELMSDEQEVPLDDQLALFEKLVSVYFDQLVETAPPDKP